MMKVDYVPLPLTPYQIRVIVKVVIIIAKIFQMWLKVLVITPKMILVMVLIELKHCTKSEVIH